MRVEFGELRIGKKAKENLMHCVETNWASGGPKVKEFEDKWSKLFSYGFSKAMSSGTDACINSCMALYDLGAKRGDEIIVPALSFIATSNAVLAAGFKPVFVDINRETLNIDPHKITAKVTPKTRAIMCVHTMGKPCEMDSIMNIAWVNRLFVIEDACESHAAKYKNLFVGHFGDMACFSFYVAHLICCGEGGMVSTNDKDLADILNSTRTHGRKNGELFFDHPRFGLNSKMNDLEASLGLEAVEPETFWWVFNTRKNNMYYLLAGLRDLEEHCWFNKEEPYEVTCPHAFSIVLKDPKRHPMKELYQHLEDNSIKTKRNFGCIPTQQGSFSWMGHELGEFPEAEYVGDNGLHFGCHQFLKKDDLDYIIDVVHDWFKLKG